MQPVRPKLAGIKPVPMLIAAAGLALVAACGTSSAGGTAGSPSAGAYSPCVRSHGVPGSPDPASNGAIPKTSAQELGVSDSRFQAALSACQHLLPATT